MPNYVKYSTNAQTRALKMGNFWLGPVNDGKGPTSSTGYYTALNPPSGGFTIYANKTSNGPSIYQASNESQLVSITNQLGGTSFTTSAQCLTWYVTQTDKFCVNREYEGIVTNGLVLNLDAGFTPSYPTSGVTCYGLANNNYVGTLTNGPTFSTTNGGIFSFDGTDDWLVTNFTPNFFYNGGESITFDVWFYLTSGTSGMALSCGRNGGVGWVWAIRYINNQLIYSWWGGLNWNDINGAQNQVISSGRWNLGTLTYELSTNTLRYYLNGALIGIGSAGGNFATTSPLTSIRWDGGNSGFSSEQRLAKFSVYNRTLSSIEVQQNYNAQKGRFGL